jgi:hypothetical protein
MHIGLTSVMLVSAAHFLLAWALNHRALGYVVDRSFLRGHVRSVLGLPSYRYVVAVLAAVAVFLAAPLCLFDSQIEAMREAAQPANWAARQQVLQDENARLRAVIAQPLPSVGNDPEVVSLQAQLNQARADWPRIRDEVVCEGDGTCGSGRFGEKSRYEEKAARRDELRTDIEVDLPREIEMRKKVVEANVATARGVKDLAERRSGEIKAELSEPPRWSDRWHGRWQALDAVDLSRWRMGAVVVSAVLAGLLYLLLDVAVLRMVARRVRTVGVETPEPAAAGSLTAPYDATAARAPNGGTAATSSDPSPVPPHSPQRRAPTYGEFVRGPRRGRGD